MRYKEYKKLSRAAVLLLLLCTGMIGTEMEPLCGQKLGIERLHALGDSLTEYARERADVQKVVVKSCRVKGNRIDMRTNSTLSCLSLGE